MCEYLLINSPPFLAFNLKLEDCNIHDNRIKSCLNLNLNFKLCDADLSQSNSILTILAYTLTTQDYYTKVLKYNKLYFESINLFKSLNSLSEIQTESN